MAKKIGANEVKIGVMVSVGLLLLAVMVLMVGSFHTLQPGYAFHAGFNFVSGVSEGAPVYLSGVEVGRVESLDFVYDDRDWLPQDENVAVGLLCWVPAWAQIPRDSTITVNTLGLMGEKYVEIIPGKSEEMISEGDYIRGMDPMTSTEIFEKASRTLDSISKSFEGFGEIVGDTEMRGNIKRIVTNLRETSENAKEITADFKQILDQKDGDIKMTVVNLRSASERLYEGVDRVASDLESFSGRVKRLGEENEKTVNESIANFHAASESLKGGVDQLVADMTEASGGIKDFVAENREEMDEIVANLNEASVKINLTMETVQSVADKVDRGEGTLGMLVNDEELSQDLRETVKNLSASSENINRLVQEIRRRPRRFVRFSIF